MTPQFTRKLDSLPETLALVAELDTTAISAAIADGRGRHALAIGSGGSAISAEYFARARDTIGLGPTTVDTPMQLVLGTYDLGATDVWLFSAGADNADIVAAARAATNRRARTINLVTKNPGGAAASEALASGGTVHAVPVSEEKDGYLATHSLIATIGALLIAIDALVDDPIGAAELSARLSKRLETVLAPQARSTALEAIGSLKRRDTLIVVADPQLRPVSILLDTSAWEASICAIQTTDFRNFAHGRHAWLHHREETTMLIALTGAETRGAWRNIDAVLPDTLRRLTFDFEDCGRLANALGVIDGLAMIEAIGLAVGIDPGKPGIAPFGRAIYDDHALADISTRLTPTVRHKRAAMLRDDTQGDFGRLSEIEKTRLERFANASIIGIVLDYDGTVVSTDDRYQPPRREILNELERLHQLGLIIGIATGRGGSAGEDLRKSLATDVHPSVLVGYYNGGYLQSLDVDIEIVPPSPDPSIAAVAAWLKERGDLFLDHSFREGRVQITINIDKLTRPGSFVSDLSECLEVKEGRAKITRSGHSFDIVSVGACKQNVVRAIRERSKDNGDILCIGDSGARLGNDFALLSTPFGISVDQVCGAPNGCWSLFGSHLTGPEALLKILRALTPSASGTIHLDIGSLTLER